MTKLQKFSNSAVIKASVISNYPILFPGSGLNVNEVMIFKQFNQKTILMLPSLYPVLPVLLLFTLCLLLVKYIIKPYRKLTKKYNELKDKYSIYLFRYVPFGLSFVNQFIKDLRDHGDHFYTRKNGFSKNDVVLAILRNQLFVGLVKKELMLEFVERQKEGCYVKKGGSHFQCIKMMIGDGLIMSEFDEWKNKRKMMSRLFNYEFIKGKFNMITTIAQQMCERARREQKEGKVEIDINNFFQKIFGTIVMRCFLGNIELQPIRGQSIFDFIQSITDKIMKRNMNFMTFVLGSVLLKRKVRKIDREIHEDIAQYKEYIRRAIHKMIAVVEKSSSSEEDGLIAKLLRQKKLVKECTLEQKYKNGYYTYQDLVDQVATFLFAGTDTTSNTIACLIHKFNEVRDFEEKVREQIKVVLNNDISNITIENIKKMTYLRYVQSQILRMFPAVPQIVMREATRDHYLGDVFIEKGTIVCLEIVAHHFKEEVFENPHEFNPNRWQKLQTLPEISQDFLPFSIGSRICIGQQLALMESKAALIIFLLNFKNGRTLEPSRYRYTLTYGPESSKMAFDVV